MWEQILPDLFRWSDSCHVYAVCATDGAIIINAGTGQWLDHLDTLPVQPVALACTHFFRDHSAGAARAAAMGIPVYVPEGEYMAFAAGPEHIRRREIYLSYENYWDFFAPITPIPITGTLHDYDQVTLGGIEFTVVPLPGATIMQIGLAFQSNATGQRVVCVGEAIHSPGRIARVAPLQYGYNDLLGAVEAYGSASDLRQLAADILLPSLGDPILNDTDAALHSLQDNLRVLCKGVQRPMSHDQMIDAQENLGLRRVTDHVWMSMEAGAFSYLLLSDSGKALVIDYGYAYWRGVCNQPEPSKSTRRRALLHSLDKLKQQFGIERIDVALLTHYHDDHVAGVPLLQRLYGTQCWASTTFADLIEQPTDHPFPCTWPQSISVDRRIDDNEVVHWEEYTFHFGPMSGHTRYASLIGFEADGLRFAHTGDQYIFVDQVGTWLFDFTNLLSDWEDKRVNRNVTYRNGALLDGYRQSADWLTEWQPHISLAGHQSPIKTDPQFFKLIQDWANEYADIHRQIMPLDTDDTHFNMDSWAARIWPYQIEQTSLDPVTACVIVRNPLPRETRLELRLVGPDGWEGSSASIMAPARAEVTVDLTILPTGSCHNQPIAAELLIDGQPFGQLAEALVSINA